MSVLIFHPSTAPFVQQAARALFEANLLDRFYTTVHDDPHSRWQRFACAASSWFGRDFRRQLRRRAITEIPADRVTGYPFSELLRLASGPFDRSGRLTDRVWEWAEPAFDRRVARQLPGNASSVYGFEHSSLATFTAARRLGLRTIYDVPAPETNFVQRMLAQELARFPSLLTTYHSHTQKREERRTTRRRAEWDAADLVIANSAFTRRTYIESGLAGDKVHVIPYGAPPPAPRESALAGGSPAGPLRLLWAGTFGIRKGAHYLLDAWRRHGFGAHAHLRIHGSVTLPDSLLQPLPAGIELGGSIPREELMEVYRQSDVLVFPTLCDGFGLVVTEAFSCGLPVITTSAAGAADLVSEGLNGLVVPPGDANALAAAISWCLDNRQTLRAMRAAAWATAVEHQWSDYRLELAQTVAAAGLWQGAPAPSDSHAA